MYLFRKRLATLKSFGLNYPCLIASTRPNKILSFHASLTLFATQYGPISADIVSGDVFICSRCQYHELCVPLYSFSGRNR